MVNKVLFHYHYVKAAVSSQNVKILVVRNVCRIIFLDWGMKPQPSQ